MRPVGAVRLRVRPRVVGPWHTPCHRRSAIDCCAARGGTQAGAAPPLGIQPALLAALSSDSSAAKALKMHTGYASIAVDASSSAASAADQSQHDAWRPQHPQRCTAAAQSTPPQPARRKDANSPTSVIDARDDKQFAPLGAAQNHAVARAALLGVALTLGVLLVMLLALGGAYPALVGPGLLALGFGLRHGIEAASHEYSTVALPSRRWRGG